MTGPLALANDAATIATLTRMVRDELEGPIGKRIAEAQLQPSDATTRLLASIVADAVRAKWRTLGPAFSAPISLSSWAGTLTTLLGRIAMGAAPGAASAINIDAASYANLALRILNGTADFQVVVGPAIIRVGSYVTTTQIRLVMGGTDLLTFDPGLVNPATDNTIALGDATHRWQTIRTLGLNVEGATLLQFTTLTAALNEQLIVVTYSASMTPQANAGNAFTITATNGTAFTINAPANATTGELIEFTIRNTAGGALGVATWNAIFKMTAWVQPANGFNRSITFRYDGTNWNEKYRTPADIPN